MSSFKILQAEVQGIYVLKFIGEIRLNLCSTLDRVIDDMMLNPLFKTVVIDLTETTIIDSTTLGLLAKIAVAAKKQSHFLPTIITTSPDILKIVLSMGFDKIFIVMNEPASQCEQLEELTILQATEDDVKKNVLEAHKVLMDMNFKNREEFKDLVATLERE